MRLVRSFVLASLLTLAAAGTASAQNAECEAYGAFASAERVCNAAVDGTRVFHPVAGLLVSGGNPVIGSGGTLGGLGHFSVTARVNATKLVLPNLEYDGSTSTVESGDEVVAPAPLVEGALGLYGGMPGGLLAIDFLGSAQLLPTDQIDNLSIDADARKVGDIALGLGYGARIGVLAERGPLPGVSVSIMRRDVPRIQYGNVGTVAGDDYSYAVDLQATNLRAVASKRLAILNVAVGLGWDKYTGDATIEFRNPATGVPAAPIEIELDNSRTMAFANAGLDLSVLKLVGELGYQLGADQELTTEFEDLDTTAGKVFGGVGLRVSF